MRAASMYELAMGDSFNRLPLAVRRFHTLVGWHELHGWVYTDAPSTRAARVVALCLGTPRRATNGPIRFELHAAPEAETWIRHFPGQKMTSRMRLDARQLVEHLGPARLTFDLCAAGSQLKLRLVGLHLLGVRCPLWLLPKVVAEETGQSDQLHFRIQVSLPRIGTVASYRGHLTISEKEPV